MYADYCELPQHCDYDHRPSDLIAIIWMEPTQHLRALADAYTMSWDASHDTNWMKLKYFAFCTLGEFNMLEPIAHGLQRHEDITVATWILHMLQRMLGRAAVQIRVCFIDGDLASKAALSTFAEWAPLTDEWHGNQGYTKNMAGKLGDDFHSFLAKLYSLKYDDDIRTQGKVAELLGELVSAAGMRLVPQPCGTNKVCLQYRSGCQRCQVHESTCGLTQTLASLLHRTCCIPWPSQWDHNQRIAPPRNKVPRECHDTSHRLLGHSRLHK